ncbi:hypothetical protein BSNK01_04180 [Bacillaceae bacterium]
MKLPRLRDLHAENGTALVLVLLIVAILALYTPVLLFETIQGHRNAQRTEHYEQAQQLAESGIQIVLAYFAEKYDEFANPRQTLQAAVEYADSLAETDLGFPAGKLTVMNDQVLHEIRSTGEVGEEKVTVTITYIPPKENLGIFSQPIVLGTSLDDDEEKGGKNPDEYDPPPWLKRFQDDRGYSITLEQILAGYEGFESDFAQLLSLLPSASDLLSQNGLEMPDGWTSSRDIEITPADLPDPVTDPDLFIAYNGGKALFARNITIRSRQHDRTPWTIPYPLIAARAVDIETDSLTIKGNVIAGDSITFAQQSSNIHVDGSIISQRGAIDIGQQAEKWVVNGHIIASGGFTLGQHAANMQIQGNLISQSGGISFHQHLQDIEVHGSIIALGNIDFAQNIRRMTIHGAIASRNGSITFNQNSQEVTVKNHLLANNKIDFRQNLAHFTILGRAVTMDNIAFSQNIADFTLWGIAAKTGIEANQNTTITLDLTSAENSSGPSGSRELEISDWKTD